MAAHNPERRPAPTWLLPDRRCGLDMPAVPTTPTMRIVPRSTAHTELDARADVPLSDADWHLLFDAVKSRLREVAAHPATAAEVVPQCLQALDWLQSLLEPRRGG